MSACSTLPTTGPTARQIIRAPGANDLISGYTIVNLDAQAVARLQAQANAEPPAPSLRALTVMARTDLIGPGDKLQINIYEVGASLFSRSTTDSAATFDPSAHAEKFPPIEVSSEGTIHLPFAGEIRAAGRTPTELAAAIDGALKGKSQQPQAVVSVIGNLTNSVYLLAGVKKPGKYDLSSGGKGLIDVIAEAGGAESSPEDTIVVVTRNGRSLAERLQSIVPGSPDDLRLQPRDQIELLRRPRTFTIFGAAGHVGQIAFDADKVSLAEALARASGPSDATADPKAIFLFRQVPGAGNSMARRIIYRLDLMRPQGYFVAQNFLLADKDLVYIANSPANLPAKFVGIINQVFSPILTVRAVTQ